MAEVNLDDLKPNSNISRERRAREAERDIQEKRIDTVGTGRSKKMREPLKKRLLKTFIDEDFTVKGLRQFIIKDIIAPSIQDAIMDGVNGALGMMFGIGIVRSRTSRTSKGDGRIQYRSGGYFSSGNGSSRSSSSSTRESRRDIRSSFEPQMKDNKEEAQKIMIELEELLDQYPEDGVTVADYYDAFGVTTEHTDNKFGWTDLSGMRLERVPRAFYDEDKRRYIDGWAVVMPDEHAL